jgi:hypothetical protein
VRRQRGGAKWLTAGQGLRDRQQFCVGPGPRSGVGLFVRFIAILLLRSIVIGDRTVVVVRGRQRGRVEGRLVLVERRGERR